MPSDFVSARARRSLSAKVNSMNCSIAIGLLILSVLFSACSTSNLSATDPPVPVEMVRAIIDHPQVEQYLHPESGRIPVVLSNRLLDPRIALSKYDHPVRIILDSSLKGQPFLRFTEFRVQGAVAHVGWEYPFEGSYGEAVFQRSAEGAWLLVSMNSGEW